MICLLSYFHISFSINPLFSTTLKPHFPTGPLDEGKIQYYILSHYRATVGKVAQGRPPAARTQKVVMGWQVVSYLAC